MLHISSPPFFFLPENSVVDAAAEEADGGPMGNGTISDLKFRFRSFCRHFFHFVSRFSGVSDRFVHLRRRRRHRTFAVWNCFPLRFVSRKAAGAERRRRRDVCKKSAFRCLSCVNIPSELLPAQYYLHSHSYMHLELSGSESRDDITLMFDRQTCQVEVISSGNGCFVTVGCVQQTLETDVGNTKET